MVTNPYTRHPAAHASALATLQELSGGRAFVFVENSVSVGVVSSLGLSGCLGSGCLSESREQEEREKESG